MNNKIKIYEKKKKIMHINKIYSNILVIIEYMYKNNKYIIIMSRDFLYRY